MDRVVPGNRAIVAPGVMLSRGRDICQKMEKHMSAHRRHLENEQDARFISLISTETPLGEERKTKTTAGG